MYNFSPTNSEVKKMRNYNESLMHEISNIPNSEIRKALDAFSQSLKELKFNEKFMNAVEDEMQEDLVIDFPTGFPRGIDYLAYVDKPDASDVAALKKQTGLKAVKKSGIIKDLIRRSKLGISLTEKQQAWFFVNAEHRARQILASKKKECFESKVIEQYLKSRHNCNKLEAYCYGIIDRFNESPFNFNDIPKNNTRVLFSALKHENRLSPTARFSLSLLATEIWDQLLDQRPVEQKSLDLNAFFAIASILESPEMIMLCMEENAVVYQHFLANSLCVVVQSAGEIELISFEESLKPPQLPSKLSLKDFEPEDLHKSLFCKFTKLIADANKTIKSEIISSDFNVNKHLYISSLINLIQINSLTLENLINFMNKDESLSKLAIDLNFFLEELNFYYSKIDDPNIPKLSTDNIECLLTHVNEQMKSAAPISGILQNNEEIHSVEHVCSHIIEGYKEACSLADEYNETMLTFSSNPMANRVKIKELNQEFDLKYNECINSLELNLISYEKMIDAIKLMFESLKADKSKVAVDTTSHEINSAEMQSQHSIEVDRYIDQINSLNSDIEALQQQLKQIKMVQKAEREHLVGKKIENMRENDSEVVPILRSIITSLHKTSLEDQLLALSALFPNVVVLPNAMASAKLSPYNNSEKSWEALLKLSNEYLPAISSGKSDSQARKVFPLNQFAANDNLATKSGAEKDKRTGEYKGKVYQFDKHLRLGYAINAEKTLRIHFDVIDKKLVIFHVGEHL